MRRKNLLRYRIVQRILCTALACSFLLISGCSRSEGSAPIGTAITDMLNGKAGENWSPANIFPALGREYAGEDNPPEALFNAVLNHLKNEGFTDISVNSSTSDASSADESETEYQYFTGSASMSSPDGESFIGSFNFQWDVDMEQFSSLLWLFKPAHSEELPYKEFTDTLFSDDVLPGIEDLTAKLNIQDDNSRYFYENKYILIQDGLAKLSVLPYPVSEEDGFYYMITGEEISVFDTAEVPEVYPDKLGGLPVTSVTLNNSSAYSYLGFSASTKEVTGACNVPVLIIPESVEKISSFVFLNYGSNDRTYFIFNPDAELTDLNLIESYSESEYLDIRGTIYCESPDAFRVFDDRFANIEVRSIDEYRENFLKDHTEEEYAMFEAMAKGDYSGADKLFK